MVIDDHIKLALDSHSGPKLRISQPPLPGQLRYIYTPGCATLAAEAASTGPA